MLDIVEFILQYMFADPWERNVASKEKLDSMLLLANSAYQVNASWTGLELRIAPEVQDQVQAVVDSTAGSAGEHLTRAWNAAYSRTPDPVRSYSESIKAVEAALGAHVSPDNSRLTLGTMIRDVTAKPEKWTFAIADGHANGVETVLNMMRTLWYGQTSRHAGVNPTRDETDEEAKAAVHFAATLVQFGVSGAFGQTQ